MNLLQLADILSGRLYGENAEFSEVSTDTRSLRDGDIFFAIKGENFNGEVFVERAFASGACAAVVTRWQQDLPQAQIVVDDVVMALGTFAKYQRGQFGGKVIALTGSCGKTSVKGMLSCILELHGTVSATKGNFNNQIGVPLTLLSASHQADYWVVEAGTSYQGEIKYLNSIICPNVALVINVHAAHIEGFGSLEAIADEKSDLLLAQYANQGGNYTAIYNVELDRYPVFADKTQQVKAQVFDSSLSAGRETAPGSSHTATVRAENIAMDDQGFASFDLVYGEEKTEISLAVLGRHQVENAVAAATCALELAVPAKLIQQGLAAYRGTDSRMQFKQIKIGHLIDDSYNANPASMRAAIDYLSTKTKSILLLGDMGELGVHADVEHRKIGEYAKTKGIAKLYCLGVFAQDYAEGFGIAAKVFSSRDTMSQRVIEEMTGDTTVLVKGSRSSKMDLVSDYIYAELAS